MDFASRLAREFGNRLFRKGRLSSRTFLTHASCLSTQTLKNSTSRTALHYHASRPPTPSAPSRATRFLNHSHRLLSIPFAPFSVRAISFRTSAFVSESQRYLCGMLRSYNCCFVYHATMLQDPYPCPYHLMLLAFRINPTGRSETQFFRSRCVAKECPYICFGSKNRVNILVDLQRNTTSENLFPGYKGIVYCFKNLSGILGS